MRGAWRTAAVGATAFACYAAIAMAAGGAKIDATQVNIPEGFVSGSDFAYCPVGKTAVGGGAIETKSGQVGLDFHASGPLDESAAAAQTNDGDVPNQWYAAADNFYSGDAGFRVYAICQNDPTARIEATEFQVPATEIAQADAVCGPGERATGGGVVQTGSVASFYPVANGPLDATGKVKRTNDGDAAKMWRAAIKHNQFGDPAYTMRVFAICSSESKAKIEAAKFKTDGTDQKRATCKGGSHALGGGIVQSGPPDRHFISSNGPLDASGDPKKTDDGDKATQWLAKVDNLTGEKRAFRVMAICE